MNTGLSEANIKKLPQWSPAVVAGKRAAASLMIQSGANVPQWSPAVVREELVAARPAPIKATQPQWSPAVVAGKSGATVPQDALYLIVPQWSPAVVAGKSGSSND